jgi:hypothetical protein
MAKPRLPRTASEAWIGGFATPTDRCVGSVSAAAGTVVAAGEVIYLLRPGSAAFLSREPPSGTGDIVAVAVEPRRPARFALAGIDSVTIYDPQLSSATVRFPPGHPEPVDLAWALGRDGETLSLYVLFDTGLLLRLVPGSRSFEDIDVPPVVAMAADEKGRLAFACFDEDNWELDVFVVTDARDGTCACRALEAPLAMARATLALAGDCVAVSFELEGVWINRREDAPFERVEAMAEGHSIAFQGGRTDSALFGGVGDAKGAAIVRVDAEGVAIRVGEVGTQEGTGPRLRKLAWDGSRRTLWAAAGPAGVLWSTEPGAGAPLGATAAS